MLIPTLLFMEEYIIVHFLHLLQLQETFITIIILFNLFDGVPVLATVGGSVLINGTFSSLQLPDLASTEDIIITSADPSFQCPSNIAPSIAILAGV